jgi:aspartyl-tRNA(Asn)/glutamyl-tRNA(Gln) amidotransferase subunit C
MSLDRADVEKIAQLARLAVDERDLDRYVRELSSILELVEQMNAADTEGVTPMAHPLHMSQRLREDEVTEQDRRAKYQAIAPLTQGGLYLVPKVID